MIFLITIAKKKILMWFSKNCLTNSRMMNQNLNSRCNSLALGEDKEPELEDKLANRILIDIISSSSSNQTNRECLLEAETILTIDSWDKIMKILVSMHQEKGSKMNRINLNNPRSTLDWENRRIKNKFNNLSIVIDVNS